MSFGFQLDLLLLATGWTHVWLAPYTKVEESFNLHATHDILAYGVGIDNLHNYDHFVFSGAVPRTFIGSLVLAWLSTPVLRVASMLGFIQSKIHVQITVRVVLASLNALGFILLRRAVLKRFGRLTCLLFVLLTISQSHLPFWMGRTVPNMFALFPVNLSLFLLNNRAGNSLKPSISSVHAAFSILTFTVVVLRSEVAMLLAPLALQALFFRHTTLLSLIRVGFLSAVASIALTVMVDSYFWNQWPLWPELYGIYFNVYQGKSVEWGVSPAHTYFTSHIPKLLLSSLPLSIVGASLDSRIRSLLVPCLAFLILISAIGHKEWRFVVYVIPIFNIAAAEGARWMVFRRKGWLVGRLLFMGVVGAITANFLLTVAYTEASIVNYPGGTALDIFNREYAGQPHVHVHLSNLATQTGASLFLHEHSPPYFSYLPSPGLELTDWQYNKTECLTADDITSSAHFTHVVAEASVESQSGFLDTEMWNIAICINGFKRWKFNLREWVTERKMKVYEWSASVVNLVEMDTKEELWVLERT